MVVEGWLVGSALVSLGVIIILLEQEIAAVSKRLKVIEQRGQTS